MDVFYEGEIVKNDDGSFGIVNDKFVNIDLAPLLFELKMNKIRENDNKKLLKLLIKQILLTEDEVLAAKFLLLVHGPDDLSCKLERLQNKKKMLSLQQQKALQWLDEGKNFFITGGKAAHLLNGVTIHAFAGKETGVKSLDYYKRHMHPDIKKTWLKTDVLIIDKISMINAQAFDLLHLIAREMKQCYDELFGGIQVIAYGDFFQMPPVKGEFVFKSKIWQQYMTEVLVLTECLRQKEDAQFFGALNEIRFGQVSDQTIDYFMPRCFEKDENLNTKYTRLSFRNMEVDVYNNNKLETIKQEGYWF
ncbi:ATP-dependent DNA helicase PIF1-like [Hydra vulgaris]|uniref:ATP-dependent DNA helicase n=1 Tax=Hydra vulgaris TaxID=6087 RepID=A0ABM4DCB1_HYDVU